MQTLKEFRKARLKAAMERFSADALVASTPGCIAYLSGYDPYVLKFLDTAQVYCVYAPETDRLMLVCGAADAPNGVEAGVFDGIFTSGEFYFHIPNEDMFSRKARTALQNRYESAEQALSAAVKAACPSPRRIAVEEHRTAIGAWKRLEADFGAEKIMPGRQALLAAKCVKHPEEQRELAAAARLADEAFIAMAKEIRPGMSEADMYTLYSCECLKRHAWPFFCVASCDERSAFVDTESMPGQIVKNGSLLRFDFGCKLGAYYSDLGRAAVVGSNEKAERYYPWIRAGIEQGIRAARSGITAGELFRVMMSAVREGIPQYQRNHTGHGIGLTMYDAPSISEDNDFMLEEGMVLCLEIPYYELGWGGIMLEETILIKADGALCLTGEPHDMLRLQP